MLSLQETQALFEKAEYKDIVESFRVKKDHAVYDHDEANLFGVGTEQQEQRIQALGQDDANKLAETVKTVPLSRMIKEFLAKSSTTGLSGAAYLIPLKIYSTLATYAAVPDLINEVSMAVIPASEIPGATLDVDIAKYGSYKPHVVSSGAKQVEEEIAFTKATLDFTRTFGINFNIGNDLIEDNQFALIDVHVRMAGDQMGQESAKRVLADMVTCSDGDGTLNTVASMGSNSTTLANLSGGYDMIITNFAGARPDKLLSNYNMLRKGPMLDTTTFPAVALATWREKIFNAEDPKIWGLNWIRTDHPSTFTAASSLPTHNKSWIFCKDYSFISGRKRWLRMENYSDPVRDLVGATITARQDTKSIYNQSVSYLYEA
jgi:hypothetical protein